MPLRRRLAWVAAAAVGVAVVVAAVVCYLVVRGQLRSEVDGSLKAQEAAVLHGDFHSLQAVPGIPANAGGPAPYVQVVLADGTRLVPRGQQITLPIDSLTKTVATGSAGSHLTDIHVAASHLRELTFPSPVPIAGQSAAVQLARPLGSVDRILSHLRLILALLIAGGMALAAGLGRLAARRVLSPLAEVAQTAQHITDTEDLTSRLRVHADDEVGQLATRFNAMIERLQRSRSALDESVQAQRQLVADASHELRTPVTSLRTNIEVLLVGGELSEDERNRLLADVVEQSEELSGLVADLIELARGDLPAEPVEDTSLDAVVEESLARARRNAPAVRFEGSLEPVIVEGSPERLGRAVNNLLDNAARHSPDGATVEVVVDSAGVYVRDHGPGVDEADLPFVFDRFYRGTSSRWRQGSGLGLAIVRQVAEQHGGSVSAANAPDGGAVFRMNLPTQRVIDRPAPSQLAPVTADRPTRH
jgi:two-component system, OmpR family, sensor histidine kinase MprB